MRWTGSGGTADRLALLSLVLLTVAMGWPLLARLNHTAPIEHIRVNYGAAAWPLWTYLYAAADRVSLLRYGQFPLWSPHIGGGYPVMGFPEDYGLSPRLLLILPLGEVAALKVDFLITQALTGIGTYLLMRRVLGFGVAGACITATCFAFSCLPALWVNGDTDAMRAGLTPLVLYLLYTADRRPWRLLGAAGALAWMLTDQKYTVFYSIWFMALVCLVRGFEAAPARRGPNWGVIGRLVLAAVWAAVLLAAKLVAMIPLVFRHSEPVWKASGGDSIRGILAWAFLAGALSLLPAWFPAGRVGRRRAWLKRAATVGLFAGALVAAPAGLHSDRSLFVQAEVVQANTRGLVSHGTLTRPLDGVRARQHKDQWGLESLPVGHVGFVLAVLAAVAAPRRHWRWLVLATLFAWISVGPVLPSDLAGATRRLPLLSLCSRPFEHLFAYRALVLAGGGVELLTRAGSGRLRVAVGGTAVVLNVAVLAHVNVPRLGYTASGEVPRLPQPGPFYQVDARQFLAFPWLYANVGHWTTKTDLPNPDAAAVEPRFFVDEQNAPRPNPAYRGEVFFDEEDIGDTPVWVYFSPNRWVFDVNLHRPGTLVVNQVYDPYWRSDRGRVARLGGLLGVELQDVGRYAVHLRYVPTPYFHGLAAGLVSLVGGSVLLWRVDRRRGRTAASCGLTAAAPSLG